MDKMDTDSMPDKIMMNRYMFLSSNAAVLGNVVPDEPEPVPEPPELPEPVPELELEGV